MRSIRGFFLNSLREGDDRRSYYAFFTLAFLCVAFCCFAWFIVYKKSFIWTGDGWTQHFKAQVYYRDYLRRIIRSLVVDHKPAIPSWDFSIGEGSDIVNTFHYYCLGDPISLLSVIVPVGFMPHFYAVACLLKLYLSGVAFSALCFETKITNRFGILAGALGYSFCTWAVTNAARHPHFLNPMIYLPLMILGVEKMLAGKKPLFLIAITAVSTASNFYFFYMIAIIVALYTVVRAALLYRKQIARCVKAVIKTGITCVLGVGVAGIIFVPVFMMIMSESRAEVAQSFRLFYPLSYYSSLPSIAVSDSSAYMLCMGFGAPCILSIILLFIKKRNALLKALFVIAVAVILLPLGGRIFNGMSYMTNRWSWAFALLCLYILAKKWNELLTLQRREWIIAVCGSLVFYALCFLFEKSRSAATFAAVPMFFITLLIVREGMARSAEIKQSLLVLVVVAASVSIAFWKFAPTEGDYISDFVDRNEVWNEWENNEARVVASLYDEEYTRMSGRSLTYNANIFYDISSTQYYWSLSNPYINRFRTDLAMREPIFQFYEGYDDRAALMTLASVQYYTMKEDDSDSPLPYGYSHVETFNANEKKEEELLDALRDERKTELSDSQIEKIRKTADNNVAVYKNENALPLAYCYDAVISREDWDALNPVQRQEAMLEAAFVEDKTDGVDYYHPNAPEYLVDYTVKCRGADITYSEEGVVTTQSGKQMTLTLQEEVSNAELYIGFEGLDFIPTAEYELYSDDRSVDPSDLYNKTNWNVLSKDRQSDLKREKKYWNPVKDADITIESQNSKKTIEYKQPDASYSSGRHDYIVNLGYTEEPVTSVKITFPHRGRYSLSNLKVYRVPVQDYPEKISRLRENAMENISVGNDTVSGEISLEQNMVLCVATPFSKGWTGYLDDGKAEAFCVNGRYLGMVVPEGTHSIAFRYSTPYMKTGMLVSLLSVLVCVVLAVFDGIRRRKTEIRERMG